MQIRSFKSAPAIAAIPRISSTIPGFCKRHSYASRKTKAQLESALQHELLILLQVVGGRVDSRVLAQSRAVLPPAFRPYPEEHWSRELQAAQRIQCGLQLLYPTGKSNARR